MSKVIDVLPQNLDPVKTTTITDLIAILPQILPWPIRLMVSGKIARYGRTVGNLIFLSEGDGDPSSDMMQYFNDLVAPLGINATISYNWRNNQDIPLHLYNEGRLIIDKKTMAYTEVPMPVKEAPIITVQDLVARFPKEINWFDTIYLVGGMTANGWSANDVDLMIEGEKDFDKLKTLRDYFTQVLGWKVQVGGQEFPNLFPIREIYKFKLYENGKCQL